MKATKPALAVAAVGNASRAHVVPLSRDTYVDPPPSATVFPPLALQSKGG